MVRHALVQAELFPSYQNDYLTIIPSESGALGFTAWNRDEAQGGTSLEQIQRKIQVSLAGREAKIYAREGAASLNNGASADLKMATRLALGAVAHCGFSDGFGMLLPGGVDSLSHAQFANEIRCEATKILASCQSTVQTLLQKNSDLLPRLATLLLE